MRNSAAPIYAATAIVFRRARLRLDGGGYFHFLLFEAGLVGLDYGEG
jgi:hypothetical protein